MAAPVTLRSEAVFPVDTYGAGVRAPSTRTLALWVGGFVLIAIFKLEVDREGIERMTPTQGYFGRWILLVMLAAVQALIVCIGDLVLGVQCVEPVAFVAAGVFASFVYLNIIYALGIAFKHIGKALAVVLLIMQIPGSSGMYPVEMMSGFFQAIHPLLPFTYGIGALREAIGGMYGGAYWIDLAHLALFLPAALLIGLVARPYLLNINLLFDRKLAETGVMVCEQGDLERKRYRLRTVIRALLDTDAYRTTLNRRFERFERPLPPLPACGIRGARHLLARHAGAHVHVAGGCGRQTAHARDLDRAARRHRRGSSSGSNTSMKTSTIRLILPTWTKATCATRCARI